MSPAHSYSKAPSPLATLLLSGVIFSVILLAEIPGGNFINLGLSATFVASVLAATVAGHRKLWFGREIGLLLLWLVFAVLPSVMAIDQITAMFKALTMVQILLLAFCIQQTIVWQRSVSVLLALYGVAVMLAYAITFTEFSISAIAEAELREGGARVASTLANENKFGAACVMGLSLCLLSIASKGPRWLIVVWFVSVPVLTMAAINSGSRTALLGSILILLGGLWAFKAWRGSFIRKTVVFLPIISVSAFALYLLAQTNPIVSERLEQTFDSEGAIVTRVLGFVDVVLSGDTQADASGESIGSRAEMIREGVNILSDHPVIGVGLDNFRYASSAGTYSHSNPIEVSVSTGIVGLVLYYSIYVVIVWRAVLLNVRSRGHALPRTVLVAMAGFSLMDLTHISYYEKSSWLFLALITGTLEVFSRELKMRQSPNKQRKRRRRRKKHPSEGDPQVDSDFEDLDELGEALSTREKSEPVVGDAQLRGSPSA